MKFVFTFFLTVGIATGLAMAQEKGGRGQDQQQGTNIRTIVGCLSQTNDQYVITGGGPDAKQIRIVGGDTSMLKTKIGQTVRVVGPVAESDPAAVAAPPYNEGSTTGVTYETIVAQKVKVLGGLCSNPGQEWKGDHE